MQFATSGAAHHATELDGTEGGPGLKLIAKMSDPTQKQTRTGPQTEGREIFVTNLPFKANEDDLSEVFSRFGTVESVILPRKVDGGSKGFAFIAFSSKVCQFVSTGGLSLIFLFPQDEANAALSMQDQRFWSRRLHVELSTRTGPKRTATTIVSHVATSQSPTPEVNGATPEDLEVPVGEKAARTLALMNVPDTVNDARIRALVEPLGRLIKVVLRPDHQGAIVEFADVHEAGQASLALEGKEINPGRPIHIGTVAQMKRQHAERKSDRVTSIKQEKKPAAFQPTGPIKRPQQPGGRSGRRGGLGIKRIPAVAPEPHATDGASPDKMDTTADTKDKKSNDDFRAMVQQNQNHAE